MPIVKSLLLEGAWLQSLADRIQLNQQILQHPSRLFPKRPPPSSIYI